MTDRRDRGAAALMAVMVTAVVAGAVLVGVVRTAEVLTEAQQARSAADAVALAGVDQGRSGAERVAAANGAAIISWTEQSVSGPAGSLVQPVVVTVEVRVGNATASARATNGP